MIVVKYCDIDIIDDGCISHYLNLLPAFMSKEILRYRYSADQKARLLSRLMLRESITDTVAIDCLKDWKRDLNNKPIIDNWNAFNIAHASNIVVFAYTTGESIGVDIEKKDVIKYQNLTKYFHPEEQQFISDSANADESFYQLWVRKEATLKAIGTGIVGGLSEFNCLKKLIDYDGQEWHLRETMIHADYTCYVCTPRLEERIFIQEFKIK